MLAAFVKAGLVASNGEARRQIKGGGLRVNDAAVTDEKMLLTQAQSDAGRRDQALARPEAARAAEAGLRPAATLLSEPDRRSSAASAAPVGNSKNLRIRPGATTEIGLTRSTGAPGGPTTSIGHADQALVAAAAEEQAEHRNLPEHVVEAEERHEGAAHAHLFAGVIDVAFGGGADQRPAHDAFADGEAAVRAGELDPHAGELDAAAARSAARRRSALPAATRSSAASPRTVKSRMLRMPSCGASVGGRRVHRHPHLAAEDLGIGVGEAEERAGVLGLDIDDVAAAGAAAQIADERRVAPELGVQREAHDAAVAARQPKIEAAQRLAVEAGDRAEPDVEIDVLDFGCSGLSGVGPAIDDLTKPRPS